MNKKTFIFGFLIIITISILAFIVYGASLSEMPIGDLPNVRVTFVNQEPDPAEPGKYVDVRFKFENIGGGDAKDIKVELLAEFPFSFDPGVSAVKEIGTLHSRQTGDKGVIVKYRLRVNKDAVDGQNEIKLRYNINNQAWTLLEDFNIDIQTQELIIAVKDILSEPTEIVPGSIAKVTINLENTANSLIKDLRVKLDLTGKPLAPIGSTNEKSLFYLEPGKNADIIFDLIAEGDAIADVYQISIYFNYVDELGTKYAKNSTIALIIGVPPDLSVVLDSTTIYKAGINGEVNIKFVNKGSSDIKFLNVKLKKSDDYIIKSSDEVYVGNIDSDDYETAAYKLFINQIKKKEIELPIEIEYKDANGKSYSEDTIIKLNLYSSSDAKKLGYAKSNRFTGIFIILVIVGVGLFFYIRKKRKKD